MLKNILPDDIYSAVSSIPYNSLCELRLRSNNPAIVNILGKNYYLSKSKLTLNKDDSVSVGLSTLQNILSKISNNSLYTINDQLIEGFATIAGGIRVGVCGEVVSVDGKIKTIKNISSLNFRFPHFVKNCSLSVFNYVAGGNSVRNTLIISPPGAGKTTYLRDLVYQLSSKLDLLNILVIDERKEIASIYDGKDVKQLSNVDVISCSSKKFGFANGIRSMKPDVIITDEIDIDRDIESIQNALTSGVKVIATMHANDTQDLKNKRPFKEILSNQLFERYIVLGTSNGVGTVEGIYNENLVLIGV